MDKTTRVSVELRLESWEWLFHVLAEFGIREEVVRGVEAYRGEFDGEFPSHGPFWALIQEVQRQVANNVTLSKVATRIAEEGPIFAEGPVVGQGCGICGGPILARETVDLWVEGPADDKEKAKWRAGEDFEGQVTLCHHECRRQRTGGSAGAAVTKFTRRENGDDGD